MIWHLIPPAFFLGILLSVGYASLFHLWGGRTLRDLALYLAAAAFGFGIGQLIGYLAKVPLPTIGQLHVVEASLLAWIALIGVREFFREPAQTG